MSKGKYVAGTFTLMVMHHTVLFLPIHLNLSWLSPIIETLLVDSSLATKIAVSKEVEIIA